VEAASSEWTSDQIEAFLWDAGVLTLAGVYGFRKAATDEFRRYGLRLATIRQEWEPQNFIHHISLYYASDEDRKNRWEVLAVVPRVMKAIGCPVGRDDYEVAMSGRRVSVSVGLPKWAWPETWVAAHGV
jgi:hypothetical protein